MAAAVPFPSLLISWQYNHKPIVVCVQHNQRQCAVVRVRWDLPGLCVVYMQAGSLRGVLSLEQADILLCKVALCVWSVEPTADVLLLEQADLLPCVTNQSNGIHVHVHVVQLEWTICC